MTTSSKTNGADYPAICSFGSAVALAADELLDAAIGFVVGHLHGRMLREIGGKEMKNPADPAIQCQFATANRVDSDAGRVGRILDRKLEVDLHRHIAKEPALHT